MQYRRTIAVLLLVALAAAWPASPARAQAPVPPPSEQAEPQNVARLQNFGTLVAFLNLASGTVRLVAIVEPSSPSCQDAVNAVMSVLAANSSKRLRAYVVWSRLTEQDTELRSMSMANQFRDRRLVHFWDGEGTAAEAFRGVVGSRAAPATDVLLLYDTDARLALSPPAPAHWMSTHPKLSGDVQTSAQLGAHANAMVRRVEAKVTDGTPQTP